MWGRDGHNGQAGAGPGYNGPVRQIQQSGQFGWLGHVGQAEQPGRLGASGQAEGSWWESWDEPAMASVVRRRQPEPPDALGGPQGLHSDLTGGDISMGARAAFPGATPDADDNFWRRYEARRRVREFLGTVPRSEPEAVLSFINARGELRTVTRGQLSAAVDRLRPRMRQIVRLGTEERWPRQRVCDYLNHISIKTFERDHLEALDMLIEL